MFDRCSELRSVSSDVRSESTSNWYMLFSLVRISIVSDFGASQLKKSIWQELAPANADTEKPTATTNDGAFGDSVFDVRHEYLPTDVNTGAKVANDIVTGGYERASLVNVADLCSLLFAIAKSGATRHGHAGSSFAVVVVVV
jgi:hypothetical protein